MKIAECRFGPLHMASDFVLFIHSIHVLLFFQSHRFRSVTSQIYRNAYGYLVVFDVTSEKSFMNVREWLQTLKEQISSITEDPDIILVSED